MEVLLLARKLVTNKLKKNRTTKLIYYNGNIFNLRTCLLVDRIKNGHIFYCMPSPDHRLFIAYLQFEDIKTN